jgi:hypothetical protein
MNNLSPSEDVRKSRISGASPVLVTPVEYGKNDETKGFFSYFIEKLWGN